MKVNSVLQLLQLMMGTTCNDMSELNFNAPLMRVFVLKPGEV